jgi:phage-related protein
MPRVGKRCHDLRIVDSNVTWRILYRLDPDAVLVLHVFAKKTATTPKQVIESCQKRLREYDNEPG